MLTSELLDLTVCNQEPIHTPGGVQSYGVLLAFDVHDRICSLSSNSGAELRLGMTLQEVMPDWLTHQIHILWGRSNTHVPEAAGELLRNETSWQVLAHVHQGVRYVELLPIPKLVNATLDITDVARRLSELSTIEHFAQCVCDLFQRESGYDRVMAYRFDAEWNGEVIAEAKQAKLESFLGLWYPASDIPTQARELYRQTRVRVLVDALASPSPLQPLVHPDTFEPLDLSFAMLRAVSPIHCEYLKNIGVRATHVTSILHNGVLWGLLSCHHHEPRVPHPNWAITTDSLSRLMETAISICENRERAQGEMFAQSVLRSLPILLAENTRLGEGLVSDQVGLLEMMKADGLIVRHGSEQFTRGTVPPADFVHELVHWLDQQSLSHFSSDRLGEVFPAALHHSEAAGLLALNIPNSLQGWIFWFRQEQSQSVRWAGDPRKAVLPAEDGSARLSPRKSFSAWVTEVKGRSKPWTLAQLSTAMEVIRPNLLEVVAGALQKHAEVLRRYQSILFEQVHDAVIVTDLEDRITFWNEGATRILGWTSTEMLGKSILYRYAQQDRATAESIFNQVRTGVAFSGRYRDTTKAGETVWLDTRLCRIHDENGKSIGLMGASRDVTAEKLNEDLLRLQEAIVRHARDNIIVTDATPAHLGGHRILYANPSLLENTGYTLDELIGKTPKIFQGPGTDQAILARIRENLRQWKPVREEVLNYRKDGSDFWVELDISPLSDEKGKFTHWISVQRNITERRQAQEAQRMSEEKYTALVDSLDVVLWELDPVNLHFIFVSRQIESMYGNTVEDWLADPSMWQQYVHPEDREHLFSELRSVSPYDPPRTIEFRTLTNDGEIRWLRDRVRLVCRSHESPRLVGYSQEITDQKLAEAKIAEANDRYRLLADNITDVITLLDVHGNVLFNSPSVTRMVGYTPEERERESPNFVVHPEDLPRILEARAANLRGEFVSLEWRFQHKQGHYVWAETARKPMFDVDGTVKFIICSTRDIQQRKELEQQVRQTQKLEAIGLLAGGIAHDFNNLLTVVNGNCELLFKKLHEDDPNRALLLNILRAGERGAGLTRQLLTFSRHQLIHHEVFDPVPVVRGTLSMMDRLIDENVHITPRYGSNIGFIRTDMGQFEQVLVNLVVNARDAMPTGGQLTVTLSQVTVTDLDTIQNPSRSPGQFVQLSVADTGTGMSQEVQTRLFEPFFTTKPQGKGTGLGLATVYGIVRQAKGFIRIDSSLGHGTTFHVHFPQHLPPEVIINEVRPVKIPTNPGIGGLILVVEDDDAVRSLTAKLLENARYTVLVASSGEEALAICDSQLLAPDLVITDVVMPGMSGHELVMQLSERYSNLKMAFVSGYNTDTVERYGVPDRHVAYLQKPYTPDSLTRFVRGILDDTDIG